MFESAAAGKGLYRITIVIVEWITGVRFICSMFATQRKAAQSVHNYFYRMSCTWLLVKAFIFVQCVNDGGQCVHLKHVPGLLPRLRFF
jgi:hypothetical protein